MVNNNLGIFIVRIYNIFLIITTKNRPFGQQKNGSFDLFLPGGQRTEKVQ